MIELTVKTLDSQNHAFTVEDDITVAQFKLQIADTVNIPAETQRMIYCGRVLQDESKLNDYDVNGKVVHLVERPPPLPNQQQRTASPPQQGNRAFRAHDHTGNAMYLGSMAFPSNLLDAQSITSPPTRSLAPSRLNVARRMLKRAEAVIRSLENPQQGRSGDQGAAAPAASASEDQPEDVTPVFEAHVIVPANSEPIDEEMLVSAVQDSLMNAEGAGSSQGVSLIPREVEGILPVEPEVNSSPTTGSDEGQEATASVATSTENTATNTQNSQTSNTNPEDFYARPSEMAELLTLLNQLQIRFCPFLERYQNFMQEDPAVPEEELRQTQNMINRVSEVLHFLGHAYHSLSDIILKVRSPQPRALLCRPIVIQQVPSGFPIQVEAQINFSSEPQAAGSQPRQQPETTATSDTTTPATTTPSAPNEPTATPTPPQPAPPMVMHQQIPMFGIPFIQRASMHVESIPLEIRGLRRRNNRNNNNVGVSNAPAQTTTATSTAESEAPRPEQQGHGIPVDNLAQPPPGPSVGGSGAGGTGGGSGPRQWPNFNDPDMEFFMEVTPGSITIDSVETAHFGDNQAGEAANQHPNDLLQSFFQMAGQFLNQTDQQQTQQSQSETTSQSTTQNLPAAGNQPGQNSQARGNTQTHPTTATHTRSTARPHVHLAQHAMQGLGFDPFLPCNSHHVASMERRNLAGRQPAGGSERRAGEESQTPPNTANVAAGPLQNTLQIVMNSFRNAYLAQRMQQQQQQGARATTGTTTASGGDGGSNGQQWDRHRMFPFVYQNLLDANHHRMLVFDLWEQLQPGRRYEEGQRVFTDLAVLLARNLTFNDLSVLNSGRINPLLRIRNEIRNFVIRRVLDGSTNAASVDRGINKLTTELQPFLENYLAPLEVRDDIDLVRSAQMLLRARLPNIINLSISRNQNALRMLVDQCRITARQFCALVVHASVAGRDVVSQILNLLFPQVELGDLGTFATGLMRTHLTNFVSNLSVPESILQPYIVRRADAVLPSVVPSQNSNVCGDGNSEEPMEVSQDSASASSSEPLPVINLENDPEPMPPVVLGSEAWHSQVPADWVPIITRDSQKQRRQSQQPPFSDAYLSGMPSKRRKIVSSSKPQGTLPQVITESVRRAVTVNGLSSIAPLESVAQAAGADLNIQSAYRDLLRASVQSTVQNNEDFTPDRFPNASNYFNKQ